MKKIILILALFCTFANAQDVSKKKPEPQNTTCVDGIRYFFGTTFQGSSGWPNKFISTVKIDAKTIQPEKC